MAEIITTEEFTPAPEQFTDEQIQTEQEAYPTSGVLTEAAAEGNLAQAQTLTTTKGVREDVKVDSDQLDVLQAGGEVNSRLNQYQVSNIGQLTPEQKVGLPGYDDKGNRMEGYTFDVFGNMVGEPTVPTDEEAEAARIADMSPAERELYDLNKQYDAEQEGYQSELDAFGKTADAQTQQIIDNIKKQFAARKAQMETINKNVLGSQKLLGARSGRQRYAAELQTSILAEEERKGIARLTEIDVQMNSLILDAEMARTDRNYALLHDKINLATDMYNQKRQAVLDLATLAKQRDDALAAQAQASRYELLFVQGQFELFGSSIATSMIIEDEEGNLTFDEKAIAEQAEAMGISSAMFEGMVNAQLANMSKMDDEARKNFWDIEKIKSDIASKSTTEWTKNYNFAVASGYTGDLFDFKRDTQLATELGKIDALGLSGDPNSLTPFQKFEAAALAVEIFGKRRGEKKEPLIMSLMAGGMSVDDIKDRLRYAQQSEFMAGYWRDASESVDIGLTTAQGEKFLNSLDRSLENGQYDRAFGLIKRAAKEGAGTVKAREIEGREITVTFLDAIKDQLKEFGDKGGKTGIFAGTVEDIAAKIGKVKNAELRTLATSIDAVIQQYRKDMTGVAFTPQEALQYKKLFPGIEKEEDFNLAVIEGLTDTFTFQVEEFYKFSMGEDAYNALNNLSQLSKTELTPLRQSFATTEDLIRSDPEYGLLVNQIIDEFRLEGIEPSDANILQMIEYNEFGFPEDTSDFNSAASKTGTISGLPSFDTFNASPGVTRSDRNNNPGNIKVSDYTKTFAGVKGVESKPAEDGGHFLVFDSPQAGANAVGKLLQTGSPYKNKTAEQAIKIYNGGGSYGAKDVGLDPNKDFQLQIKDPAVLARVIKALMKAEGYTGLA